MNVDELPRATPCVTPSPSFDAHDWLSQFAAVGGSIVFNGDKVTVTQALYRRPPENQREACRMITDIMGDPERLTAVLSVIAPPFAGEEA